MPRYEEHDFVDIDPLLRTMPVKHIAALDWVPMSTETLNRRRNHLGIQAFRKPKRHRRLTIGRIDGFIRNMGVPHGKQRVRRHYPHDLAGVGPEDFLGD